MNVDYLKKSIEINEIVQKKDQKKKLIKDKTLNIVKKFMIDKQLICYGGTAINDLLPKEEQFYNYDVDIPDYDFFSPNAIEDAKELCDIFSKENVYSVESKSAFVYGTYKVYVNYVAIADITQIDKKFYEELLKTAKKKEKVLYVSPNFLKMSLHQELARPLGSIDRWEKIYSRLTTFNNIYPVTILSKHKMKHYYINDHKINTNDVKIQEIYNNLFKYFKTNKFVFCNFDIVIRNFYKYIKFKPKKKDKYKDIFIIYTEHLDKTIKELKEKYDVKIDKINTIYKFVDNYAIIYYNDVLIGILFKTNSCLSYNTIKYEKQQINIGNIDTILNLYFTFILIDNPINNEIVLELIHKLQYLLTNYGDIISKYDNFDKLPEPLKRFNLPCYGEQDSRQDILKKRNEKYKKYKNKKTSKKYKQWFFKYSPKIKKKTRKIPNNK